MNPLIETAVLVEEECTSREVLAKSLNELQQTNREIVAFGLGQSTKGDFNVYDYIINGKAPKLGEILVFPIAAATAEAELRRILADHTIISYTEALIGGKVEDILVARAGATLKLTGTMSTFGGPTDTGMKPNEGLAIVRDSDLAAAEIAALFIDPKRGAKGRNLKNDAARYIACRWVYSQTPREFLLRTLVTVRNPASGVSFQARPVDWGPSKTTGRVADLSDKLAADLGLHTDQECEVFVPLPGRVGLGLEKIGRGTDAFRDTLVRVAQGQAAKYEGINESSEPLRSRIKGYWDECKGAGFANFDFENVGVAWSAAFTSWCILQAGASGADFAFSPRHSHYIRNAIQRALANPAATFVGVRIEDYAPQPGDLIHINRSKSETIQYDDAATRDSYESHCAIVVGIGKDEHGPCAFTIGGNESDSVRTHRVALHADGKIVQKSPFPYICVLRTT